MHIGYLGTSLDRYVGTSLDFCTVFPLSVQFIKLILEHETKVTEFISCLHSTLTGHVMSGGTV